MKRGKVKRESISPWFLIGIGGLVSILSLYTVWFTSNENKSAMQIFAFIGIIFLVYGVIRQIIKSVSQSKLDIVKEERNLANDLTGTADIDKREKRIQEQVARLEVKNQEVPKSAAPSIVKCPVCHTNNYSTSKFCHMCGYKLRG